MKVIFCTPTATPPLWLTEKYPEVLNADLDGNTYYHGTRRHYNLTSPVYREFSRKITEKLAEHYVNHPRIIGWQLDNEINCEMDVYYSESDHTAFRRYMKKKYETLERLNEAMGTGVLEPDLYGLGAGASYQTDQYIRSDQSTFPTGRKTLYCGICSRVFPHSE